MIYTKFGEDLGWRNVYAVLDEEKCFIMSYPPADKEFVHFSLLSDPERDLVWDTWKEFCHDVSQGIK